jgi:hypothetical protein
MTEMRRFPRCNTCGHPLRGADLWLIRHARDVTPDMKKCSRCNRKETIK